MLGGDYIVRRVASLLLALVAWAWSAGVLAAAMLWGLALRCDDACGGEGWRRSEEGWQWNGIVALGAITFAASSSRRAAVRAEPTPRASAY